MSYHIDKAKFNQLIERGWKVVDVRDPYELTSYGKYDPSLNIPYPKVITNHRDYFPNLEDRLIFVCNYGNRSGLTARYFQQLGYKNVYVLDCGIQGL